MKKYLMVPGVDDSDAENPEYRKQVAAAMGIHPSQLIFYYVEKRFDESKLDRYSRFLLKMVALGIKMRYGVESDKLNNMVESGRDKAVDFLAFLFIKKVRMRIIDDLSDIIRQYPDITMICHSNGTIIGHLFIKLYGIPLEEWEATGGFDRAEPGALTSNMKVKFAGSPIPWKLVQGAMKLLGVKFDGHLDVLMAENYYSTSDPITKYSRLPRGAGVPTAYQFNSHTSHDLIEYLKFMDFT